jgi:hypothetical protein
LALLIEQVPDSINTLMLVVTLTRFSIVHASLATYQ